MKLKQIKLKNFRGYLENVFDINNLSVIIGENDVGKSTIIDALDIFFNDLKPDFNDLNVYRDTNSNMIEISCSFEVEENKEIIIDSSAKTTLEEEYLLNKNNLLEISKTYDFISNKIKESVRIIARHPRNFEKSLISLKITDLKKIVKDLKLNVEDIDERRKKDFRKIIFENTQLDFDNEHIIETSTKDTDIQNIYEKIKEELPVYLPFRADRTNTDKDKEVNDTTKAITKTAVLALENKFNEIKEDIKSQIQKLANKTLEKLKSFDENIAKDLQTNIETRTLDSLFSFTFNCEDGISFNKRGSGVKRLMLLSFFLAEKERENSNKNIIYAIEEPETSQHPNFQIMLMNSLKELACSDNHQVILTTHTPEIVKMVNKENLIFIQKDLDNHSIIIENGDNIEISKVADTLGILPFVSYKGVIFVEGTTDRKFLKNLCRFEEFRNIEDLTKFTIIPLNGCGNIDIWIKEDYLKNSNIKCFYIKDKDKKETKYHLEKENNVLITNKLEIENYIPCSVIENYFNIQFSEKDKQGWDEIDVSKTILSKVNKDIKERDIKNMLESDGIWKNISLNMLDEDEIISWFTKINEYFKDS